MMAAALLFVFAARFSAVKAHAQAEVTAARAISFTLFAGATGTRTGFGNTRNLSVTAGCDLDFQPANRLAFSLELRGTYPVDRGSLVAQKNILIGPRVRYQYRRFEPYANVLVGRGSLDFGPDGYLDPNHRLTYYTITDGNVFVGGGGLRYRMSDEWRVVVDLQEQRYATPVAASGHVMATAGTIGLAYTFPPRKRACFFCR